MYTLRKWKMHELIGLCTNCGKQVFCREGFLEGIHADGKLYCLECAEKLGI